MNYNFLFEILFLVSIKFLRNQYLKPSAKVEVQKARFEVNMINFSDSMIFAMSVPNIIGLYFLSSGLKKDLKGYRS